MTTISEEFMAEMAAAIQGTITERVGEGAGFILITVTEADDKTTDFKYISNIQEEEAIKEMLTQVVTHDQIKN